MLRALNNQRHGSSHPKVAPLCFVAREAHDKTRALPKLYGLSVGEPGGLADRLLIVSTLYYGGRRGDATIGCRGVEAVMRHGDS